MLKAMTLNLNYYEDRHGEWPARRDLICEAIDDFGPDVVALQAVCRDPGRESGMDQAAQLSDRLPTYQHVHFRPFDMPAEQVERGSAFLSRIPLLDVGCQELSLRQGLEDRNRRGLLGALLNLPSSPVYLFNGHLSWVLPQAVDNLRESLAHMRTFPGGALFMGDMNTIPQSELWEPLKAAGWHDVWPVVRPADDGFTFESDRPYMRIDYVWASGGLENQVKRVEVIRRERAGVRLSDHLGLLVEF